MPIGPGICCCNCPALSPILVPFCNNEMLQAHVIAVTVPLLDECSALSGPWLLAYDRTDDVAHYYRRLNTSGGVSVEMAVSLDYDSRFRRNLVKLSVSDSLGHSLRWTADPANGYAITATGNCCVSAWSISVYLVLRILTLEEFAAASVEITITGSAPECSSVPGTVSADFYSAEDIIDGCPLTVRYDNAALTCNDAVNVASVTLFKRHVGTGTQSSPALGGCDLAASDNQQGVYMGLGNVFGDIVVDYGCQFAQLRLSYGNLPGNIDATIPLSLSGVASPCGSFTLSGP